MPRRRIQLPHHLGRSEARARTRTTLGGIAAEFAGTAGPIRSGWSADIASFRITALGFPVAGTAIVDDSAVVVTYTIPLVALPVAGRVDALLRTRLRTCLDAPRKD